MFDSVPRELRKKLPRPAKNFLVRVDQTLCLVVQSVSAPCQIRNCKTGQKVVTTLFPIIAQLVATNSGHS